MSISIKSRKAKGRRFQQEIAQKISDVTGIPCGKDKDVESRPMAQSGCDIILRGKALELFPYSVECFPGETLVLTKTGFKPIQEILVGEKVFTDRLRFRRVAKVFSRNVEELLQIKTSSSSFPILSTPDHPFENFYLEWEKAVNSKYLSHLLYMRNSYENRETKFKVWESCSNQTKNKNLPKNILFSKNLFYLIGLYIAEGHVSKRLDRVVWTFSINEETMVSFVYNFLKKILRVVPSIIQNNNTVHVSAASHLLAKFFYREFGTGSKNKKLGNLVFLPKHFLSTLLKGCFDGDGCYKDKLIRYDTSSYKLAQELQFSLFRFGIPCSITLTGTRTLGKSQMFSLKITSSATNRVLAVLNSYKNILTLPRLEVNFGNNYIIDLDRRRFFSKVESKILKKKKTTVFNLSVEEDETFIIENSIVVHNCKNQENINLWDAIEQAKSNQQEETEWLLFLKRNNIDPIVVMDAKEFFNLIKYVIKTIYETT